MPQTHSLKNVSAQSCSNTLIATTLGFFIYRMLPKQNKARSSYQAFHQTKLPPLSPMKVNKKFPSWHVWLTFTFFALFPIVAIVSKNPMSVHIKFPYIDYQFQSGEVNAPKQAEKLQDGSSHSIDPVKR